MDRRHHAARAAAGQLDRGKREREESGEAFDRRALCGGEMRSGPGGKDEQLLVAVPQLKRVPGEVGDLIPAQGDDGFAGCRKGLRTVSRCAGSSIISSPTSASWVPTHNMTLV